MNEEHVDAPQEEPTMEAPQETPSPQIDPFSQPSIPEKNRFSRKRIIIVVIAIFVLAGIGFAAALLTSGEGTPSSSSNNKSLDEPIQQQSNATTEIQTVSTTKTLKADFPRVEVTYPDNWVATENHEQEGIRIESPEFTYTSVTGSPVKGNFRIYIRQGARQQDSKYIGRGIAAQDSEKLMYANPVSSQRPETNLSFFGLDTSDNFAYFLIAGNFALKKDESLGPEYGTEAETFIITGGYSSNELTDDLATNPVPVEYFSTTNAYKQALDILKSLKLY